MPYFANKLTILFSSANRFLFHSTHSDLMRDEIVYIQSCSASAEILSARGKPHNCGLSLVVTNSKQRYKE